MSRRRSTTAVAGALVALLTIVLSVVSAPRPAEAAGLQEVTGFGSNPGALRMFRYAPDGLPAGRPVVVALHGCTQNAQGYATGTGWMKLADQWRISVVFPQQSPANNANSCFNWFEPADTRRGSGEALSIKQMVDRTRTDLGSSAAYATGLSAGGGMTAVLLATYPDVFTGGGIVAGLPFGCATSVVTAFSCMNPGVDQSPAQWGDEVRAAADHSGTHPRVSIWQGTADTTVSPRNATELIEQWTDVNGTDQTPDTTDTVAGYRHQVYGGTVEYYEITGMGHGQPVDPGTQATQCGTAGAYILDVNICSAYHLGRFWGLDPDSGPGTPTSPPPGPTGTAVGSATDHYIAGRVDVTGYNVLGTRYGYTTPITLYHCATGWTDKPDCGAL